MLHVGPYESDSHSTFSGFQEQHCWVALCGDSAVHSRQRQQTTKGFQANSAVTSSVDVSLSWGHEGGFAGRRMGGKSSSITKKVNNQSACSFRDTV